MAHLQPCTATRGPRATLHTHLRPCVFDKNNAFGGRIQQFARLNGAKMTKRRAQTMKNGLFCPPIDAKKCKTQGKNAQNWTKIRQKHYKPPCVCPKKADFGGQNTKNVRQNLEFVPKRRAIQSKTAPKRRATRGTNNKTQDNPRYEQQKRRVTVFARREKISFASSQGSLFADGNPSARVDSRRNCTLRKKSAFFNKKVAFFMKNIASFK